MQPCVRVGLNTISIVCESWPEQIRMSLYKSVVAPNCCMRQICVRVGTGDPVWRESAPISCEGSPEYNFQFSVRVGLNEAVDPHSNPSQAAEPASCYRQHAIVSRPNPLMEVLTQSSPL